ncbi:hypothetical protein GIB67_022420, partial [Kingdonia uniflora]
SLSRRGYSDPYRQLTIEVRHKGVLCELPRSALPLRSRPSSNQCNARWHLHLTWLQ